MLKLLVQASVQLLLWLNRRFGIAYKIKAIVIQCFKVLISMDEDDQIRFYISSIGQQLIKIVFESALSMTQELQ